MTTLGGTPSVLLRLIVPDDQRRAWLANVFEHSAALQVVGSTADLDEVYGGQAIGITAHVIVVDLHLPRAGQNEFWAVVHQLFPWCRLMALWRAGLTPAVLETALAAGAAWVGEWEAAPEQLCQLALLEARGEPPAWAGRPLAVQQAYGGWAQSQPQSGALRLIPQRRVAVVGGREHRLSRLSYRLLERLYHHNGRVVSTTALLQTGWPYAAPDLASLAQLKTAIHRLRQRLEPHPLQPRYILTAPGGYALCATGQPPPAPLP